MLQTDQTRLLRATLRSWRTIGPLIALAIGTWGISTIPAVSSALHVSSTDFGWLVAIGVTNMLLMMLVHRTVDERSALYGLTALTEQLYFHGGLLWLIYRTGRGDSFFWLLYVPVGVLNATMAEYRRLLGGIFIGMPVLLGLAFLVLRGDPVNAALVLAATATCAFVFIACSNVSVRFMTVVAERERMAKELADLRVRDDRLRIARDLHDGVGADLAALAWRARRIEAELGDSQLSGQLSGMTERATQGIDDLRSIVWALRARSQTWDELVAYIRQRCHELCVERAQLTVEDLSEGDTTALPGDLCLHVVRAAQESVRNAIRHAGAQRISIILELRDGVRLVVEDDGRGLPSGGPPQKQGGLSNLRARAEAMGGSFSIEPLARGTRLDVRLGMPAVQVSQG